MLKEGFAIFLGLYIEVFLEIFSFRKLSKLEVSDPIQVSRVKEK